MRGNVQSFTDFRGGVNARDSVFDLQPNQARDVRNVVGAPRGAVRTRNGCVTVATVPAEIHTVHYFGGGVLLGCADGHAYFYNAAIGSVTSVASALTAPGMWFFANGPQDPGATEGPVYLVTGAGNRQWTGTGSFGLWTYTTGATIGGQVGATFAAILYHNNQMFAAGVQGSGDTQNTLWASNLQDPTDWDFAAAGTSAYSLDLDPVVDDQIIGLGTVGEYLLVFKRGKIYVITDTVTGANRVLVKNMGCAAPRSIVETPNGCVFLGSDYEVWATDGTNLNKLSQPISPLLQAMLADEGDFEAAGVYFEGHYYLSIATASPLINDLTLDFDFELGSWWIHDFAVSDWAPTQTGPDGPALYGAKDGTAVLSRCFVPGETEDNDSPFVAYWKGPHLIFGSAATRKRVRQVRVDGTGEDVQFALSKDYEPAAAVIKTADLSSSQTIGRVFLPTPGVAKAWSLEVQGAGPFEIDAQSWAFTARAD